ncbi:hypothetical protein QJS66_02825 [Kocuria rhizophila]|nr:hypothetical protein QJS66_02825 [Kocuria rhizophila]
MRRRPSAGTHPGASAAGSRRRWRTSSPADTPPAGHGEAHRNRPRRRRAVRGARQGSEDVVGQHRRTGARVPPGTVRALSMLARQVDEADEIAGWLSELRGSQVTCSARSAGQGAAARDGRAERPAGVDRTSHAGPGT